MPTEEKSVITLGKKQLSPEEEQQLRAQIQSSKKGGGVNALKGNIPLGHVEKPPMPILRSSGAPGGVPLSHDLGAVGVTPRPPGSPPVSAQTLEQLEKLGEVQHKVATKEEEDAKKKEEEEKKQELFESFDFTGQGEAERILNNKKRRKEIEDRCEPMKLEDLIMRDEVRQRVPIVPNEFEVVYRSSTPEESLFVKNLIARENSPSESYSLEKYSLCLLCCSILSINGKDFPDHRKSDGSGPDEALFAAKLKQLTRKSMFIVADLGLNYSWFDIRVRRLLAPEKLGNG
jgi:hypothetical protein